MKKIYIAALLIIGFFTTLNCIPAKAETGYFTDLLKNEKVLLETETPEILINGISVKGDTCKAMYFENESYLSFDAFVQDVLSADITFSPANKTILLNSSKLESSDPVVFSYGTDGKEEGPGVDTDNLSIPLNLQFFSFNDEYTCIFVPSESILKFLDVKDKSGEAKDKIDLSMDFSASITQSEEYESFIVEGLNGSLTNADVSYNEDFTFIKKTQKSDVVKTRTITLSLPETDVFRLLKGKYMVGPFINSAEFKPDENGNIDIVFDLNRICACNYMLSDGTLTIDFIRPSEKFDKIVVIDPGHGGYDPGAVRDNIYESNLNLAIATEKLGKLLEDAGIKVYYTRDDDYFLDLSSRPQFASEAEADLFISIHQNTHSATSVHGISVFYSKDNNEPLENGLCSKTYASTVLTNLVNDLGGYRYGIYTDPLTVTKRNTMPAILVECGFISNAADLSNLTDRAYRDRFAESLANTFINLFKDYPTQRSLNLTE